MHNAQVNRRIVVVAGVAALLMILGVVGRLGPLGWVVDHTVLPVAQGFSGLGSNVGEVLSNVTRVSDLARDNARLEQENADLRQRLASDAQTKRDNDLLRQQLGLEIAGAPRQVAAEVVLFAPDSYRQFVTINKGSKAGLAVGMAVTSQGVLIGTIASVRSTTAQIMLVTDPEFKLAAEDQATQATGILEGQLGNGLVLDEIGQTDTVKPGDSVTTSGLGGLVPTGLLIGSVQSVNTRANVVFQSAQVETQFRVGKLRFVEVVLGS